MGEVYFAPAHEPPTLRSVLDGPSDEPSPWVHVGHTTGDGFAHQWVADYDADHPDPSWTTELRTTLMASLSIARTFEVPLHMLGTFEPPPRTASVRINYRVPTLDPEGPWKRRGLTGRRYRIARRRYGRARRDWIRRGRPHFECSTFIPAANVNLETP